MDFTGASAGAVSDDRWNGNLDGDDSFAHFENPEWVKKMQAKAKKFAALASGAGS